MKIISNDKIYIQNNDITQLLKASFCLSLSIPNSVFDQCFGKVFICDDNNRFDFISFSDNEAIEFFKNLDYIVDYDEFKDLSDDEIMKAGESIMEAKNDICRKYNALSDEEKQKNGESLLNEYKLMEYKMYSVRDILWYKQGHIKMTLPNEPKGIRSLVKSFFSKKRKDI